VEKQKRRLKMKSSELIALSDQSGWRISEGYYIQLKHGLMGTFPAIISKTGNDFVCLTQEDVTKVVSLLPKRPYEATNTLFYINEKEKIAFILSDLGEKWRLNSYEKNCEYRENYESKSVVLLTKEDVEKMKSGDLKWAPGLIGPTMSAEEFKETLELAAKQGPP
jgi:hypothetical protein